MAKLNEIKPEELTAGLTMEQKKAVFGDFIKTNKEDAATIWGSDIPKDLKKELTEFIELKNEGIKTQIDGLNKLVATRKIPKEGDNKPVLSLGEYAQILAKMELRKHEPNIILTEEQVNKFTEVRKRTKTATDGMSEGDFSSGGSFLNPEYSNELIKSGYESSGIINLCRPMTTSGNSLEFKAIDDYDKSSGYVAGAVIMYWINERASITASKPTTSAYKIELCKLAGLSYSSAELIEDSPISIEQQLTADFAEAFALAMDDTILNGVGTSQPEGILNAPCLVSQAIEGGQDTTDPIKAENIMKMWAHMRSGSQRRAVWVLNPDLLPYLPQMNIIVGLGG
jgi:HK97 family phage major capsid protein